MPDKSISIRRIALLLGIVLLAAVAIFARRILYLHQHELLLIAVLIGIYCYLEAIS